MSQEGKRESQDDIEMKKFQHFIAENNYTVDQMREAYYQLTGVSDEKETTSEVGAILNKMREMTEREFPLNRFPISRFASLIGQRQNFEKSEPLFHMYVDTLKVTDKEKSILRSIIDKRRSGEVVCLVEGEEFAEVTIQRKDFENGDAILRFVKTIERILLKMALLTNPHPNHTT